MSGAEQLARVLAGHFAQRPWDAMAKDRVDLRNRLRFGYDVNEATRDDCMVAAIDAIAVIEACGCLRCDERKAQNTMRQRRWREKKGEK